MKKAIPTKPQNQLICSEKKPSTLSFYIDHLVFKLEPNHTPRTIFYKEIDKVRRVQYKGLHYTFLAFSSALFFITFGMFFMEEGTFYNVVTSVCVLIMSIVNFKADASMIKIKRGALETEVFKSSKKEEVKEALKCLKSYQTQYKVPTSTFN